MSSGRLKFDGRRGAQVIELAQECWAHDPKERPSMKAVCSRLDAILGSVKTRARAEKYGARPSQ